VATEGILRGASLGRPSFSALSTVTGCYAVFFETVSCHDLTLLFRCRPLSCTGRWQQDIARLRVREMARSEREETS